MELAILTFCAFVGFNVYAYGVRPVISAMGVI